MRADRTENVDERQRRESSVRINGSRDCEYSLWIPILARRDCQLARRTARHLAGRSCHGDDQRHSSGLEIMAQIHAAASKATLVCMIDDGRYLWISPPARSRQGHRLFQTGVLQTECVSACSVKPQGARPSRGWSDHAAPRRNLKWRSPWKSRGTRPTLSGRGKIKPVSNRGGTRGE